MHSFKKCIYYQAPRVGWVGTDLASTTSKFLSAVISGSDKIQRTGGGGKELGSVGGGRPFKRAAPLHVEGQRGPANIASIRGESRRQMAARAKAPRQT